MIKILNKHIDKLYHALAGILIAIIAITIVKVFTNCSEFTAHVIAFCAVIAGGALKEFRDWKSYGKADMYDIMATVLGGFLIIGIDKFLI